MDGNKKRPLEDDDDGLHSNDAKKPKIAHEPTLVAASSSHSSSSKEVIGLPNLCDDVLMHIFKYLSNDNLANMAQ